MAQIHDILANKGPTVFTISKDASVYEAALLMNEHKIGALVVTHGSRVEGIFTERDVLRRVVAERRDPAKVKVGEVMTREVACCQLDTSIEEARSVMKNRRIRHLPVVNGAQGLEGVISIGDLNAHDADTQEQTIHFLHEYLYGRA